MSARIARRLDLAPGVLPGGGNFYPDDDVLGLLLDLVEERAPKALVTLGSGLAAAVLARAVRDLPEARVWGVDHDPQTLELTREMLRASNGGARCRLIEAELIELGQGALWYRRASLDVLPRRIDLLFVDGPPHFAGKAPRAPAATLFDRVGPRGVVVLDDGRRTKERRALDRWARDHPDFTQRTAKTDKGAVILTRQEAAS